MIVQETTFRIKAKISTWWLLITQCNLQWAKILSIHTRVKLPNTNRVLHYHKVQQVSFHQKIFWVITFKTPGFSKYPLLMISWIISWMDIRNITLKTWISNMLPISIKKGNKSWLILMFQSKRRPPPEEEEPKTNKISFSKISSSQRLRIRDKFSGLFARWSRTLASHKPWRLRNKWLRPNGKFSKSTSDRRSASITTRNYPKIITLRGSKRTLSLLNQSWAKSATRPIICQSIPSWGIQSSISHSDFKKTI